MRTCAKTKLHERAIWGDCFHRWVSADHPPIHQIGFMQFDRELELKILTGLALLRIGRNMTTLLAYFGEPEDSVESGAGEGLGRWILEVFGGCPWRILKARCIAAGSDDFRSSPLGDPRDPWDEKAVTRFDLMADFLNKELTSNRTIVELVEMDGVQGFTMHLSNRYSFVVLPADTEVEIEPRYWRVKKMAPPGEPKVLPSSKLAFPWRSTS